MSLPWGLAPLLVLAGVLGACLSLQLQAGDCPSSCNCTKTKNGSYLKVRCYQKVDLLSKLDLTPVASQIVHLDVSRNIIEDVEEGYFHSFINLKRLDLSFNKIRFLKQDAFQGLNNLEGLKLSSNNLTQINKDTFSHLKSLRKLEIGNNTVDCDCGQSWLLDWARNFSGKLSATDACASPTKRFSFLQWIEKSGTFCSQNHMSLDILKIQPQQDQVVFEGDPLRLQCQALLIGLDSPTISWFWGKQDPSTVFQDIHIENVNMSSNGTFQSSLLIDQLTSNHSGQWNCLLVSGQTNHSRTVSVIVISEDTVYCPETVSRNDKGIYVWPQTVVGFTAELLCEAVDFDSPHRPLAYHECSTDGNWLALNTSSCPYASETTRLLQDFSKMNLSEEHGPAIVESARRLLNLSCGSLLSDKMDAVFLSRAIKNYLKFLPKEKEVGPLLIDMVSCTVQMSRNVLKAAQLEDQACSRFVHSVEVATQHSTSSQPKKATLAVEEFRVTHESFLGITCLWYSVSDPIVPLNPRSSKLFHCYQGNDTTFLASREEAIEASVQIPSSLFYQLERQGKPVLPSHQLLISMYENSHFFPRLNKSDSNDRRDVASSVIGAKLVGMDVQNLIDPLYIVVQAPAVREAGGWARPVWWDEEMNGGVGGWSEQGCTLSHLTHGKLVFYCDRFGYFGLLQEMPFEFVERVPKSLWQLSHPAIYIGSLILILSLIVAIVTYVVAGPHIQMPKRTKHALINTWVAISLLGFFFSVGAHQTDDVDLCQSIGMILHYLTLCVLLWMAVTVSNMRQSIKKKNPLEISSEDDLPASSHPPPKPLLGLYLVGWGIGLMVVGVSGAVNLKQYRYIVQDEYCFLVPNSALGAVLVPCAAVIGYLLICALLVRCDLSQRQGDTNAQLSDGTQGTENVDLDLLDCSVPARPGMGSFSIGSTVSSEVEDAEHTPATQLRANLIVLLLFASLWGAGAFSTASQLHTLLPHAELIFATMYAVTAFLLAAFILFFHCFARSDVRPCWRTVRCRGRHVSDTRSPQLPQYPPRNTDKPALEIPASDKVSNMDRSIISQVQGHGTVSNHISSSTSINSGKSHNQRAAVELNKDVAKPPSDTMPDLHKAPDMHLRPVYPSYPSVTDVEMFYNPRQSDMARKFFRKQKRHAACTKNQTNLRRVGDGEGNHSDLESTLRDSLKGCGSKVSNTNIHVESHETSPTHTHNHNIMRNESPTATNQERWVIGADSPPAVNNDGTVRSNCSNRVSGRIMERSSSRRRRSRGIRDTNASQERTRENYQNGTVSSVSSVRSRDIEMDGDFMQVSYVERTPNCTRVQKATNCPWDESSVLSGASYSLDQVSEADNDARSMSRSSRRSSRSPSSRRRHRRIDHASLRSHPTSLASSVVSLQNREPQGGIFLQGAEGTSCNEIEDAADISKKETCV